MNQYQVLVQQIMKYLADRKMCSSSRKSHSKCYDELGVFLSENSLVLSKESTGQWLQTIKETHNRQECLFWRQYVDQLQVFGEQGFIPDDIFYQIKSSYDKVPSELKDQLDLYLSHCKPWYTDRSFELTRIYCSRIMLFFSSQGISRIDTLTMEVIDSLYHADFYCSKDTWYVYFSHARQMLAYFAELDRCPIIYSMILKSIYPHVGKIDTFTDDHKEQIRILQLKHKSVPTSAFNNYADAFLESMKMQGYQHTPLKISAHVLKAFYLFLVRYELDYTPELSWIWFSEIQPLLGSSWKSWRRVLKSFEEYMKSGMLNSEGSRYTYKPDSIEMFPDWCKVPVQGFMDQLIRSFRCERTARNYKFSCLRFCRFLLNAGLTRFQDITLDHIRTFSITDKHETAYGRATSFAVVRQFLFYLGEQGLVFPRIYQGLFPGSAKSTVVTDILTDEQVKKIYSYRSLANTPKELRNVAIVLTGLELGLRASDVVNLKLSDIDWKNRKVAITQEKTKVHLELPLSNTVGNSLYRYLRNGRPDTDSPFLFVHQKAPHSRLSTKICINSLYSILPERKDVRHKGFHVTRRTFATRVLRNGAGINAVMDSLGHTDNTTVMKYLSFDEERMRMCPLPLDSCQISLKGGLV